LQAETFALDRRELPRVASLRERDLPEEERGWEENGFLEFLENLQWIRIAGSGHADP
jgi:hypothetical protein